MLLNNVVTRHSPSKPEKVKTLFLTSYPALSYIFKCISSVSRLHGNIKCLLRGGKTQRLNPIFPQTVLAALQLN